MKYAKLWKQLYSTLTTAQIDKAIRAAGLRHNDWLQFCDHMKGTDEKDTVCTIKWAIADIREALLNENYQDSDENVQKLIKNRLERTLQEASVQHGWEILSYIVTSTDGLKRL